MQHKILGSEFYMPPAPGCKTWGPGSMTPWWVGIVAVELPGGMWTVRIGFAKSAFLVEREIEVARGGKRIKKSAACGHFPELDPNKFWPQK